MTTLYVGNLSFRATEEDIRQAFARFGPVASVDLALDRETGQSRGFAYVEMPDEAGAEAAIHGLDSHEILGSTVVVSQSVRPATRPEPPQASRA